MARTFIPYNELTDKRHETKEPVKIERAVLNRLMLDKKLGNKRVHKKSNIIDMSTELYNNINQIIKGAVIHEGLGKGEECIVDSYIRLLQEELELVEFLKEFQDKEMSEIPNIGENIRKLNEDELWVDGEIIKKPREKK